MKKPYLVSFVIKRIKYDFVGRAMVWWNMLLIPALEGRDRQIFVSSRLAWSTEWVQESQSFYIEKLCLKQKPTEQKYFEIETKTMKYKGSFISIYLSGKRINLTINPSRIKQIELCHTIKWSVKTLERKAVLWFILFGFVLSCNLENVLPWSLVENSDLKRFALCTFSWGVPMNIRRQMNCSNWLLSPSPSKGYCEGIQRHYFVFHLRQAITLV